LTWIFIKNIPPELYGINLEKWKKEQQRTIWTKREVPNNQLKDFIKRGSKVLEEKDLTAIIEEPSTKTDSAHKIFDDIIIRDKVDAEIYAELLAAFNLQRKDVGHPTLSYYSALGEQKVTSHFITIEKGKKVIKSETRVLQAGSQQIIFLLVKREPLEGILSLSYLRGEDGVYRFDNATLNREKENLDKNKIPEIYHLPRTFSMNEGRIKKTIFED
jgi:hypothetical protein